KEPWASMPVRELELVLEIERSFETEDPYGRVSGIAEILEAPLIRQDLVGKRIFFQLKPKGVLASPFEGSFVRASGLLEPRSCSSLTGFGSFLDRAGVVYEFDRGVIHETTKAASEFLAFCSYLNNKMEAILRLGGKETSPLADVGVAMMLGKKTSLAEDRKERYVMAGVMHLFAISGLHVGVVAATMAFFLRWLPSPKWLEASIGLFMLFLFVQATGGSPSATRAFIMIGFLWGARLLGRAGSSLPAIAAAAFATLLMHPRQLWDLGFQLSYLVVAAIILYGIPLGGRLHMAWQPWASTPPEDRSGIERFPSHVWRWFSTAFGVSFAATLASAPLVMDAFGVFTPGAVLLNVFLVLLAGVAIVCGFASLVCGLFSLNLISILINHLQWALIWLMDGLVNLFLAIPGLFYRVDVISSRMASVIAVVTFLIFLLLVRRISFAPSWIYLLPIVPLIVFIFIGIGQTAS
ncbi:MAG: ComEC/Rec2 family competence protein, partial [Opitutales bacterium]